MPKYIFIHGAKPMVVASSGDAFKNDVYGAEVEHPSALLIDDPVDSSKNPEPSIAITNHFPIKPQSTVFGSFVEGLLDLVHCLNSYHFSWFKIEFNLGGFCQFAFFHIWVDTASSKCLNLIEEPDRHAPHELKEGNVSKPNVQNVLSQVPR